MEPGLRDDTLSPAPPEHGGSRRVVVALAALAVIAAAATTVALVSRDGQKKGSCGPTVVEQLDSRLFHVLPDSPVPTYLTDPPTSGPHVSGLRVTGAQDRPLSGVEQVSTLELGVVIVQYGARIGRDDLARLVELAGDRVTVAPTSRDDDQVIVTGWVTKMTCRGVDRPAVDAFIARYSESSAAPGAGR